MPIRRHIDPVSRDYTLTLGQYDEGLGVTSEVISRVVTRRGSIVALPSYGSTLYTIKGPVAGFETLAKRAVEVALTDMLRSGKIRRLSVSVQRAGSVLDLSIHFYDRRGRQQTVNVTHRMTGA